MRIDPLEVIASSMTSVPVRLAFAWLCGMAGAFTPLLLSNGIDACQFLGWQWLLFPFYLFYMATDAGWWTIIALPLLALLGWRIIAYMRNENMGSDLFAIFSITYLIGIRGAAPSWPLALTLGAYLICQMVYLDRRDQRDDFR